MQANAAYAKQTRHLRKTQSTHRIMIVVNSSTNMLLRKLKIDSGEKNLNDYMEKLITKEAKKQGLI
jgi:hypothetical protein